jgi:putative FmdB family regulatory protein
MPTYEYACIECDKSEEVTRGFHDPETIPPCPICGYSMVKVYHAPGVQFKGSGFYKTDNG